MPQQDHETETETEVDRLRYEVETLRAELAAARSAQERLSEKEARLRSGRAKAVKVADVLSTALADRLRIEAAAAPRRRGILAARTGPASPREAQEVELIRGSGLFDAAWYLRQYLDVVRLGEEPALHFLRNPIHPLRQPSALFDTARYLDDHPGVDKSGVNPLVHFLLSPESLGADRYPPED